MTSLNLIRVPVATNALARWAGERGWTRGHGRVTTFDEGRALHHLLSEILGPGVFRPFRMLVPLRRTQGNLYGYSKLDAVALHAAARAHALPDHLSVLSLDRLEGKSMPNTWRVGQRLGFDLRVRPIRRLRSEWSTPSGEKISQGSEIDAFLLEALRQHPTAPDGMVEENRTREVVYLDWLAQRLAPAAELNRSASRLARFRRTRVSRGNSGLEGPDATIHGTLTVTDSAAFAGLLARGVGRHRAYGYGMLLLRPPNRPAPER